MKVIVLVVVLVTIWQWKCISSLPTKNETHHNCHHEHHHDPENLNRPRRNVLTKVTTSITKATKYVGKKLHIIKRNVSPMPEDRNKTEAALKLENWTNDGQETLRVTRSGTPNLTITTDQIGFKIAIDTNSSLLGKETNESKVLNVTSHSNEASNNQSGLTETPLRQANITFFIEFFDKNDTNVRKDIKAVTPIRHHHHHSNLTKRDINKVATGSKRKSCCSRNTREAKGNLDNNTHVEKKQSNKTIQKFHIISKKCTCIVLFGHMEPLLSEASVQGVSSEPLLAELVCSTSCAELSRIYYVTNYQKFCSRLDTILKSVSQSKDMDVTRDLIYCQVFPEQEPTEEPVFPKISWSNVIILNVFACLIGLTFLLCVHLICSVCFHAGKKQKEKWVKTGVITKMESIRVKQNKAGNV